MADLYPPDAGPRKNLDRVERSSPKNLRFEQTRRTGGEVRIDMSSCMDETGARRVMRQRTRKMQYTRRINARIDMQRDIVWQVGVDGCGLATAG